MRFSALISSLLSMSLCLSCGERGNDMVVWSGERDNIEDVEIVSIDNSLPPMHSNTHLIAFGDSLIFHDYHDTGYQFKVYDIKSEKYVGEFGKFGNGPGEIANFGGTFTDHANGIMYGMNCNQWSVVGIEVDKALNDTAYRAFVRMGIDKFNKPRPFLSPCYINDSAVVCVFYVPDKDWKGLTSQLGVLNLVTQDTEDWEQTRLEDYSRYMMALSIEDSLIVTAFSTHDRICMYDLDGNLKRTVYGPEFEQSHREGYYYYDVRPVIADGLIYNIYVGDDIRRKRGGSDIVVMDMEGNYIKTLSTGLPLKDMVYHHGTNRLYLSTDGEPQFGYIQL